MSSKIKLILMASLILSACSGEGDRSETPSKPPNSKLPRTPTNLNCPTGSSLTYENFGEGFMLTNCTSCHARSLEDGNRAGAPVKYNFDKPEDIANQRGLIRYIAADPKTARMPPAGRVSELDQKRLLEWIDCGAPGGEVDRITAAP